jgi:hypothetical protein
VVSAVFLLFIKNYVIIFIENKKGVFLLEDLETFCYNIMDAKTAHLCSEEYKEVNQKKQTKENLARWKKEFKKSLDAAIKEGKFKCLVRIPPDIQPGFMSDIPEEDSYGTEIFEEWLKEKGYQVKTDLLWFIIKW